MIPRSLRVRSRSPSLAKLACSWSQTEPRRRTGKATRADLQSQRRSGWPLFSRKPGDREDLKAD